MTRARSSGGVFMALQHRRAGRTGRWHEFTLATMPSDDKTLVVVKIQTRYRRRHPLTADTILFTVPAGERVSSAADL
jgi:hypothetical protein